MTTQTGGDKGYTVTTESGSNSDSDTNSDFKTDSEPITGLNKEIYLIRHGETDWNRKGLGQGSGNDIKMNDTGKQQAKVCGKYLKEYRNGKGVDLILSSPLSRAKETAQIIAKQIGYKHEIVYMDGLMELDHGLLATGKTRKEMQEDPFYKDYFNVRDKVMGSKDPIARVIERIKHFTEGNVFSKYKLEPMDSISDRANLVIDYLKKTDSTKILVVTHGGFIIKGLISEMFGIEGIKGDYDLGSNCHITYLTHGNKGFQLLWGPSTRYLEIYGINYRPNHIPIQSFIMNTNGEIRSYNNVDNDKISVDTQFRIGSVTKIFTGIMVLLCQEKGLLDVNDKLSKHGIPGNGLGNIKIRDLLTHTSGLKGIPGNYKTKALSGIRYQDATSVVDTFIDEQLLKYNPGTYHYSNTGYLILGRVIEGVTEKPWIEGFKQLIFDPLGMSNTGIGPINHKAYHSEEKLIYPRFKVTEIDESQFNESYYASTGGGLHSTVRDIEKFLKSFHGLFHDTDILDSLPWFNKQTLSHDGMIYGGFASIRARYDGDELSGYRIYLTNVSEPYF